MIEPEQRGRSAIAASDAGRDEEAEAQPVGKSSVPRKQCAEHCDGQRSTDLVADVEYPLAVPVLQLASCFGAQAPRHRHP